MKTFEEFMAEQTITIELDYAGTSSELKAFVKKAAQWKPVVGNSPNGYSTVTLTGDRKKLEAWCHKNYDDDMDEIEAYMV